MRKTQVAEAAEQPPAQGIWMFLFKACWLPQLIGTGVAGFFAMFVVFWPWLAQNWWRLL